MVVKTIPVYKHPLMSKLPTLLEFNLKIAMKCRTASMELNFASSFIESIVEPDGKDYYKADCDPIFKLKCQPFLNDEYGLCCKFHRCTWLKYITRFFDNYLQRTRENTLRLQTTINDFVREQVFLRHSPLTRFTCKS